MMDSVTALERSYQHLQKTVANVGVDQLTSASQCERWDLRALLNHTFGAGWMFTLVNQGRFWLKKHYPGFRTTQPDHCFCSLFLSVHQG